MAGEMAGVMDEQLQVPIRPPAVTGGGSFLQSRVCCERGCGSPQAMLVSMVDSAEGLCSHVMKKSGLRQELLKAGAGRVTVPRGFITTTLVEQAGADIMNKIRSVWLQRVEVQVSFVSLERDVHHYCNEGQIQ